MTFADIHMHLLFGVDDGAEDEEQMKKILDAAYADGTRVICATPHFHPGYFGDNREAVDRAYEKLLQYAKKYADLQVFRGNELRYGPTCVDWVLRGDCHTINDSSFMLVDFSETADAKYIVTSVLRILNSGYTPILAHAERYESFSRDLREIRQLQDCGVLIQVDSRSPFGGWGPGSKKRSRRILEHYYADIVASDAHNVTDRPPLMKECYDYVFEKCGGEYAKLLFLTNPMNIINDCSMGKEIY